MYSVSSPNIFVNCNLYYTNVQHALRIVHKNIRCSAKLRIRAIRFLTSKCVCISTTRSRLADTIFMLLFLRTGIVYIAGSGNKRTNAHPAEYRIFIVGEDQIVARFHKSIEYNSRLGSGYRIG